MSVVFPSFAALEALLAAVHGIASDKRTAFQARLKNFHRLGFPAGVATAKGKPTEYSARAIFEMALAIELTQLGMRPESIIALLSLNRGVIAIAVKEASELLLSKPKLFGRAARKDAKSTYLIFDPRALESLMEGHPSDELIFIANRSQLTENLEAFTVGPASRAAVVNITSLLDLIAPSGTNDSNLRRAFLEDLRDWALGVIFDAT